MVLLRFGEINIAFALFVAIKEISLLKLDLRLILHIRPSLKARPLQLNFTNADNYPLE